MKHLFTGTWVFVVVCALFYLIYTYIAHPLMTIMLANDESTATVGEVVAMSIWSTFIFALLFGFLLFVLYHLGKHINER